MLSEKIKEYRKKHNLTQEQLAKQLFVSRSAVAKWEQNKGLPNSESLNDLANIMQIPTQELINQDETLILVENIEKNNIKSKRNLITIFVSIIIIIATIFSLIYLDYIKKQNSKNIIQENKFYEQEVLDEFGIGALKSIDCSKSLVNIYKNKGNFYADIDSRETFDRYLNYTFSILTNSPYISRVSFAIDRPEEAYNQVSFDKYLIHSDKLQDYTENQNYYTFYYFTNLDANRNIQDKVKCKKMVLNYYQDKSAIRYSNMKDFFYFNFSIILDDAGEKDDIYSYYLTEEFYNVKKEEVTTENFSEYFNEIASSKENNYYYFQFIDSNYFIKSSIFANIEAEIKYYNGEEILTKKINFTHYISSPYNWSTALFIYPQNDEINISFSQVQSVKITSVKIDNPSYIYFCEPIEK